MKKSKHIFREFFEKYVEITMVTTIMALWCEQLSSAANLSNFNCIFSSLVGDSPSSKSVRIIKSKSAADKDLDWRSARPSTQNSSPSTAFKSLYKNTTQRVHGSSTYPTFKQNRQNDDYENGERRDSMGLEFDTDNRPISAARLRRFPNSSPRVSECSSVSSDNETVRNLKSQRELNYGDHAKTAHVNNRQQKEGSFTRAEEGQSLVPDEGQGFVSPKRNSDPLPVEDEEALPCTNSFSILPLEEDPEQSDPDAHETSMNTSIEDLAVNSPSPENAAENIAPQPEEEPDDLAETRPNGST